MNRPAVATDGAAFPRACTLADIGIPSSPAFATPPHWQVVPIGHLARVTRGASPRPIDNPGWFDAESGTGWLRIADVTAAGKYLLTTKQDLSAAGIAHSRFVPSGNLVMSICATVGRPIITAKDVCIHDGFVVFGNLKAEIEYVYYVLSGMETTWSDRGQTGSQMNLNTDIIKSAAIPVPPSDEQRAISKALSAVDGLLQALEMLITKKLAVKQATIQQFLTGKTRLPGFDSKWRTAPLGEVAGIVSGATPDTMNAAYWDGTVPWCTPTDITSTQGKYLTATDRNITTAGLTSCPASLLPIGALLLCTRATIGEVKIATFAVCTNQGFKSLIPKDCVSNEFLYYLLVTLKPRLTRLATGSTFGEIGKRDIASVEVTLPRLDEQRAIADVLSDMDAEIVALEQRFDKTRAIKQAMMQQLLTGRVRLVEPVAIAAP